MGKNQGGGENTKKIAGNARKAEAANAKAAAENAKKAAAEDQEWSRGAKSNAKKEEAAHKKQEAARKKAEKDALLAAEESTTPSRAAPKNSKTAVKKSRHGLDLSQLDDSSSTSHSPSTNLAALNATGIDNALDALSLTTNDNNATGIGKVDRHPERRFKAAYAAYETRRLAEMEQEQEQKGLRRQQRIEAIRKEFEKSAENPFNQVNARFDSTKEEIREIREKERAKIEARLVEK